MEELLQSALSSAGNNNVDVDENQQLGRRRKRFFNPPPSQPFFVFESGCFFIFSHRFKALRTLYSNKREGYYVFKGVDLVVNNNSATTSSSPTTSSTTTTAETDGDSSLFSSSTGESEGSPPSLKRLMNDVANKNDDKVIIFLQLISKAESYRHSNIVYYCDYFEVEKRKDFVYRGKSNQFYYICVLKYSDELVKFI